MVMLILSLTNSVLSVSFSLFGQSPLHNQINSRYCDEF
ncbi:hypothetical protein PVAP13_9NG376628 [Panicum virgatum]|uniref:Uncharacterized protein n=1 Tax=Panicum virgatum TaxID=38727 RepID=A0A8T0MSA3_PANVG|nr:hypothetical protein PVAP13_9NG376628 [Panicum virgatum]